MRVRKANNHCSWDKMKELVGKKLDNTPNIPTQVQLQLPKLELPKLS